MTKVMSNKTQLWKLVDLMQKNDDIAKGTAGFRTNRTQIAKRWAQFSIELNKLGPPARLPSKWIKVWTDLKFKTRQKHKIRARLLAAGNKPTKKMSDLEVAVGKLLDLDDCANQQDVDVSDDPLSHNYKMDSDIEDDYSMSFHNTLFNNEINETEIHETGREQEHNASKISLLKELVSIEKDKLKLKKEGMLIKKATLEIEKEKLAIEREKLKIEKEKLAVEKKECDL